jgi:hypothetical protein
MNRQLLRYLFFVIVGRITWWTMNRLGVGSRIFYWTVVKR